MENKNIDANTKHAVATRDEWLKARLELLSEEKQLTHQSDEVARRRRELPWVRVEKDYIFETDKGQVKFADLFEGRSQLLMYHFMFGKDYAAGCPHCSAIADGFNGIWQHLAAHDVMLWAVSHGPLDKLQDFKKRMGWGFPWASSFNGDFNYDFNVSFSEEQQRTGNIEYNYNKGNVTSGENNIKKDDTAPEYGVKIAAEAGTTWKDFTKEAPGMSAFVLQDGIVYHTYSAFARGLDGLWNIYQWLDRAPLGRNETGLWMKHHDKYENIPGDVNKEDCCK